MEVDLRPATLEDAELVADLDTIRVPDDPHDAKMVAYWWTHSPSASTVMRLVGLRDGRAVIFIAAGHQPFQEGARRYGFARTSIHPDAWTLEMYRQGIATAEAWLRTATVEVATASLRASFVRELDALAGLGYREVRRERYWELDLVAHRTSLLAGAERSRAEMHGQGITLTTLERDDDPATLHKVHELDLETTQGIPTTVPIYQPPFDEWCRMYFENPGVRKDRFWIARLGDEVIGMSLIEYPPRRGIPSTEFTGTSPRFRGRGIARALKYQTVAQAIALGAIRLRTDNDSENAPILHLNAEMGYQAMTPHIQLHREL